MGAFTHRVIEQRAGVYHGATTHFFGTRDELVDAVFGHLFALDAQTVREQPGVAMVPVPAIDPDAVRAMITAGACALFESPREARARYALVVHAAQEPRLQGSLRHWRGAIVEATAPFMAALGSTAPQASARAFIAGVDGLLLHRLSTPDAWEGEPLGPIVDALPPRPDPALSVPRGPGAC